MMRKEMPEVIARIKEAIVHYGLTAADLGLARETGAAADRSSQQASAKRVASRQDAKPRRAASVNYRDDQGNRWSGFGPSRSG